MEVCIIWKTIERDVTYNESSQKVLFSCEEDNNKPRQLLVADQNWTGDAMNLPRIKMKFGDAILYGGW